MKRLVSILFLSIYLLSSTEAKQLLKLPVIFMHYAEHKQENSQITFIEFLAMHYLHGSPRDKDYDKDMQLPFKTTGEANSFFATAFDSANFFVIISVPISGLIKLQAVPQSKCMLSSYLSNIWQPPRLA